MLWELDLRVALAPLVSREAAQELGGHHSSNLTADPARGGNETCLQLDRNVSRFGRVSHPGTPSATRRRFSGQRWLER